jgi:hypothetical protein
MGGANYPASQSVAMVGGASYPASQLLSSAAARVQSPGAQVKYLFSILCSLFTRSGYFNPLLSQLMKRLNGSKQGFIF